MNRCCTDKSDKTRDTAIHSVFSQKPELDAEDDEDVKGLEAKSERAETAGSERVAEGIVADEVEEKEAVVNSLESSLASSSDLKKVCA